MEPRFAKNQAARRIEPPGTIHQGSAADRCRRRLRISVLLNRIRGVPCTDSAGTPFSDDDVVGGDSPDGESAVSGAF